MVSGDDSLRDYGADDCREGALDIRIRRMCGLRQVSLHVDDCEGRERTRNCRGLVDSTAQLGVEYGDCIYGYHCRDGYGVDC